MGRLLNINEASTYLGVSQDCLRKWDRSGKLIACKTAGGHRRYDEDLLKEFVGIKESDVNEKKKIVCATYSRVSSNEQKQKGDLDRQSQRLSEYCAKHKIMVTHIIKDVGSGMNDNRSGFVKLTNLIIKQKVNMVVVEHKDRLTRFQFNFIKKMFESYGCKVVVVEGEDVSNEEELCQDMMSLLASFSGRFYGKRSAERRKKSVDKVVDKNLVNNDNGIK